MSSVLEKSSMKISSSNVSASIAEKRGFFLRTSSLQKIKCSATYPFRIAGTKFSKDAVKELFETLIVKARIFSQKAFIDLLIATFKLVGVLMSLWISVPARDGCDNIQKTGNVLGFHERLFEKIHKLQKHKQRFESTKTKDSLSSLSTSTITKINSVSSCHKLKTCKTENNIELVDQSKLVTEIEKDCALKNNNQKNNYILVLFVYSSAIYIYLQLLILAIALNTTQSIPPGLLFLITSLLLIAVIVFKVFLIEKPEKCEIKSNTKQNTGTNDEKSSSGAGNNNIKRIRTRNQNIPMLSDLNSKTLSKIKIL